MVEIEVVEEVEAEMEVAETTIMEEAGHTEAAVEDQIGQTEALTEIGLTRNKSLGRGD